MRKDAAGEASNWAHVCIKLVFVQAAHIYNKPNIMNFLIERPTFFI